MSEAIPNALSTNASDIYIGLSDELVEGTFAWDSGEPLSYTNFDASTSPGVADYVVVNTNGLWQERAAHGAAVTRAGVRSLRCSGPLSWTAITPLSVRRWLARR